MRFYKAFASLDINWTYRILFPSKWTASSEAEFARHIALLIFSTWCLVECSFFHLSFRWGSLHPKVYEGSLRNADCLMLNAGSNHVKPIAVQNFESKYQGITWNNHPPCRNFGKPLKNHSLNSPRHAPGPGGCFSCQKGQGCELKLCAWNQIQELSLKFTCVQHIWMILHTYHIYI